MDSLKKLDDLFIKYKGNRYRLNKDDSEMAIGLIVELLKDESLWEKTFIYVIDFPKDIGIKAYYDYYISLPRDKKINLRDSLIEHSYYRENARNKSAKRTGALVSYCISSDSAMSDAFFFMQKMNELLLDQWGVNLTEQKIKNIVEVFDLPQEVKLLKLKVKAKDNELCELEQNLEKCVDEARQNQNDINQYQREVRNLNREIEKYEEQNKQQAEKLENLILINREKDANLLKQFKNKLASLLRPDYKNLKEIENEEISTEIGEVLRIKIDEIYTTLQDNGIMLENRGE